MDKTLEEDLEALINGDLPLLKEDTIKLLVYYHDNANITTVQALISAFTFFGLYLSKIEYNEVKTTWKALYG